MNTPIQNVQYSKQQYKVSIQECLDTKAREYGYDSMLVAATYADSHIEKYRIEATKLRQWRNQVLTSFEDLYARIQANDIQMSRHDIMDHLPQLQED